MSGASNNSVLIGIEVATYVAGVGVVGWLVRSTLAWQKRIERRLGRANAKLRKIDMRGTHGNAERFRDLEKYVRDLANIRDTLVAIQQNTATMSVELENTQADVSDHARRIDRLEGFHRDRVRGD